MNSKTIFNRLAIILLLPISAAIVHFSSKNPDLVEKLYASGIYPLLGQILSRFTGILPFSLAEIIVIVSPAALIIYTINVILKSFCHGKIIFTPLKKYLVNIITVFSIAVFSFLVLWGFNYYRMPFAGLAGLDARPSSVEELENVSIDLIERANELRSLVSVDEAGSIDIPGTGIDILKNSYKGFEAIYDKYPYLKGSYGNPKPVLLSKLLNYTGICGIYFPFTGEANVNVTIPDSTLPSTAAHEMAHQRGFSREDEANFIAYLASTAHPDVNYKYSGVLLALINSMNALNRSDPSAYLKLTERYSEGVRRDLAELSDFWSQYEGPVERTSNKLNNAYLKANKQSEGVQSYGRMVDLLIAEYRKSH